MSAEQNKAIAREFIKLWGNGSLDIIDKYADPALTVYYPAFGKSIQGGAIYKKVLEGFRSAFSDLSCSVEEEISDNDKVVLRWTFSATHSGNFLGFSATNKRVKWTGMTFYRIVNGKVTDERGEEDIYGFLRRIGAIS
jgi:steroid delta-isomerase-like uncharacterized protein